MTIYFIAHVLVPLVPLLIMYWGGHYFGRRSRDAEVSALEFQYESVRGLAMNNAVVADKVIAEIGKCLRRPA